MKVHQIYRVLLLLGIALLKSIAAEAQRLDAIGKEEPLTVGGTISTNFIGYSTTGQSYGRDPFTSYVSGSLNFDLYGVAVPLSFSYSSQSAGSFQQPFNQLSLHPSYKWATMHIGFTSMNFSSHTLSGHSFAGVGLDLTPPGRFKVSTMFGRLIKATPLPQELIAGPEVVPAYARWGGGVKLGYVLDKHSIDLIVFKAKDDATSILAPPDDYGVKPKDNLVAGLNLSSRLLDKLTFRMELSASAITNDTRVVASSNDNPSSINLGFLYRGNSTSALYKAIKTGVDYSIGRSTIGMGYERIDPEYQTLGAYFTTNDLENITANFGTSFFESKLQLSANIGKQRDNLDSRKSSSFTSWVGALSANATPTDKINLSLSYSSFQSFTHIRSAFDDATQLTPYDNLDTLKFTQINQSIALMVAYRLMANEQKVQMLTFSANGMLTSERQGGGTLAGDGTVYNGMVGYSLSWVPAKTSLNLGLNINRNSIAGSRTLMVGPTASFARSLLDGRLNSTVGASYSMLKSGSATAGSVLNGRIGANYSLGGKGKDKHLFTHQVGLSAIYAKRFRSTSSPIPFSDFTITLSYSCNMLPQKYWLGTKSSRSPNPTKN